MPARGEYDEKVEFVEIPAVSAYVDIVDNPDVVEKPDTTEYPAKVASVASPAVVA